MPETTQPPAPSRFGAIADAAAPVAAAWALGGFRLGARLLPWIGFAITAYDAWRWWNDRQVPAGLTQAGWVTSCPTGFWGGSAVEPQLCSLPGNSYDHATVSYGNAPVVIFQNVFGVDRYGASWAVVITPDPILGPDYWYGPQGITNWTHDTAVDAGQPLLQDQYVPYLYSHPKPIPYVIVRTGQDYPIPVALPFPVPPMWSPFDQPIGSPVEAPPIPIPWEYIPLRRPDPWLVDPERSDFGYGIPRGRVDLPKPVKADPDVQVKPDGKIDRRPPSHTDAPPKARTRERKVRPLSRAAYKWIQRGLSLVTEGGDLVEAFWDALPEKIRKRAMAQRHGKKPSLTGQLEMLYEHWDKVDLDDAVGNVIKNQIEDKVYGFFGKHAGEAAARDGRATAYGRTRLAKLPGVRIIK